MSKHLRSREHIWQCAAADDSRAGSHQERVERLFRAHRDGIRDFLKTRRHPWDEAKELTQEAYLRVLGIRQPETVNSLMAYLVKTAANLSKNRLIQRKRRQHNHELELPVFGDSEDSRTPERIYAGLQEIALVHGTLNKLPTNCRRAFLLVHLEGRSIPEVARRLKVSERQVRRYIAQVRASCLAAVNPARKDGREDTNLMNTS